ncbi:MAG TPA: Trk system potassium transporter TrkA [Methanotrichaceae archaeon]|nr:Trk system potassium transporter TrkA [Methanotrichaceae archaeon]HQF16074.1 Trk system potassium transporter TrkA [Methanotrichaceae archaeon]HQI90810.1 Trk system potassium transporter TrkA [Methanotrichaceae archaeon]HQJ28233.1 Trk system potassium transporter TrkA [Methanotrichaceae archaeon]
MRILITGAGEVGYHVARALLEEHDVTVIDQSHEACQRLEGMDVKVLEGNAANASLLNSAGLKDMDVVLAVTGNDEVNIITCIIAGNRGVTQTIARVSNPEYTDQPVKHRRQIGISYMICPELVMAEELARTLYFPSMLMNRQLAGGKVELIEFKVTESMLLTGPISGIAFPKNCKLVAINRSGEIMIPRPDDTIRPQDHLIMICHSEALPALRSAIHEENSDRKVVIVGGGMVGFYLASRLEKINFDLKLVEIDKERCMVVAEQLSQTMILNGDGTDINLLKEENVSESDVVFAVTGLDEKNLLTALLAKQLGSKKIISRVNKSEYIRLFELVGVDRAISPGQVTVDAVLQLVIGGEDVITLSDERMELVEFATRRRAKVIGKNLLHELPEGAVVGMVLRNNQPIIPDEKFKAEEGDLVFVLALPGAISRVKKLFLA